MAKTKETPVQNAPKFRLSGFYVKDISFENPLAPAVFMQQIDKPDMKVGIDVNLTRLKDTAYEVSLRINARAEGEGKAVFHIEMVYAGLFVLNPEIPAEEHDRILLIDCASVIFPFARRVVADLVQEGGFPPLLLEPINFEAVYQSKRAQAA